jgi:hypothetical protein
MRPVCVAERGMFGLRRVRYDKKKKRKQYQKGQTHLSQCKNVLYVWFSGSGTSVRVLSQ